MTGKNKRPTYWIVNFLDGNKAIETHPTQFDMLSARQFCKENAARGVRCSMRKVESNSKESHAKS